MLEAIKYLKQIEKIKAKEKNDDFLKIQLINLNILKNKILLTPLLLKNLFKKIAL